MSSGIEQTDKFGEVRAEGKRAWHGMGIELPPGLTCVEGAKKIGLGWNTRLLPMEGVWNDTDDPANAIRIKQPNSFLHVREDTKEVLATVGRDYRPIPNLHLAQFCDALVGADATVQLETGGSLNRGRRVFFSVKLPRTIEVVNEDILEMYILVSNAHDGSAAAHAYPTSVRVVCQNTLRWSERDLIRGLRIQHTGDISEKIHEARAALGIVVREMDRFKEDIETARRLQLNKAQAKAYFEAVYNMVFGDPAKKARKKAKPKPDTEVGEEAVATSFKHREKMVGIWLDLLDHPNQQIKGIQGTGWAAYNAFSQWSDHERGNTRGQLDPEVRAYSNLFGVSSLTKQRAWKGLISGKMLQTA